MYIEKMYKFQTATINELTPSQNSPNIKCLVKFIKEDYCKIQSFWVMTNLMHSFLMYLFMPLNVSSSKCSSSGGPNCINTSSGITHFGDCPTCRSRGNSVLIQFGPTDDEHLLLETCGGINKYIKKESIKLVITQNCIEMHGQQNRKVKSSVLLHQVMREIITDVWRTVVL
jgi:hypothetical protein